MSDVARLNTKREVKGFVLESGVPIPPVKRNTCAGACKYPFDELEIGEGFFLAGTSQIKFGPYISVWKRRNSSAKKFTVRSVEGGIRVWRVA